MISFWLKKHLYIWLYQYPKKIWKATHQDLVNRLVLLSRIITACYVLLSASISHDLCPVRSMYCFCNKKKKHFLILKENIQTTSWLLYDLLNYKAFINCAESIIILLRQPQQGMKNSSPWRKGHQIWHSGTSILVAENKQLGPGSATAWVAHLSFPSFWERHFRYSDGEGEDRSSRDTSALHRLQKKSASRWITQAPGCLALDSALFTDGLSTSRKLLSSSWPSDVT